MSATLGKYIVIEGSDGTGKTTQMNMLREYLQSHNVPVHVTSEPADPSDDEEPLPIARELRKLIKNGDIHREPETNLLLFTAARVEKWRHEIKPALESGCYVLSSRNYWSTLAYQGHGEGLTTELILQQTALYLGDTGYLSPDAAVILTMSNEHERQTRVAQRGLHESRDTFETKDQQFQSQVAGGYLDVAATQSIPLVEASGTVQEVADRIMTSLRLQIRDFPA